ncbi:hypothetical protein KQI86_01675 [Clostridium sp. MSJ-11]|uniref:Uncharacterized protein n=1 Tax=Clostridium mobile TaxID=2841512 RepID=A0ABS6ECV3_9CLOT|nr:hypothetical protein [Clostridium mobile]MBU5483016.1 hypothetical protein [Clostridium mobile]
MFLITINVIAIKKEKKSFSKAMDNAEENINDYSIEILNLRKEMAETILQLQMEIEDLKESINCKSIKIEDLEEEKLIEDKNEEKLKERSEKKIEEKIEENKVEEKNNVKIDEVKQLIDKGMDLDQVAQHLQIGKGELLLIKELYLK